MSDYVSGDMVRGHIDSIILNSLLDSDKDTGMIREEIEKRASGKFQLKQGTFYSALQRIVKNGLVIEYRTTGSDGVRRKFFQLTEKGKAHIEKNQNSWTVSQEIINTLLDSEGPQVKFHKPSEYVRPKKIQEEAVPIFISEHEDDVKIPKFNDVYNDVANERNLSLESENADFISELATETETEEESDTNNNVEDASNLTNNVLNIADSNLFIDSREEAPTTFDDILDMLSKAEEQRFEKSDDTQELENKLSSTDFVQLSIDEKNENEASTSEIIGENLNELSDDEKRIRAAEQRAREEEEAKIFAEKQEVLRKKLEEEARIAEAERVARENAIAQIKAEEEAKKRASELSLANETQTNNDNDNKLITPNFGGEKQEKSSEQDDYLNDDDLPNQKEYRNILNRIFANDPSPAVSFNDQKEFGEQYENDEQSDVIVDTLDFSAMRKQRERAQDLFADEEVKQEKIEKASHKKEQSEQQTKKIVGCDYSDIIKLSEQEGFKISTADNTNKSDLGKILINKLNFHTGLVFFAIVALETLIVALTMEGTAKLGVGAYFIFLGVIAVMPIVFGITYYLTPKRVIGEVSSFKGSFETALIITLNLVLLIIAVSIVINLDFSSATQLSRGIFIPVMISINVPVFVIVRYSLLENQAYFS